MEIAMSEKYVTNAKDKKISVILSYKRYKKRMEDLHDLAVIAERHDEQSLSLSKFEKRLKDDGSV